MTGIRRSVLLLALAVASVVGALGPAHPAQATFSEKVAAPTVQVTTATVLPPASATATLKCTASGANLTATWPASTTARVDGYLLTVVYSDGFEQKVASMVTGTTWTSPTMTLLDASTYFMHVRLYAHTDYGWTSTTVRTQDIRC
jgi:hypothetical protein